MVNMGTIMGAMMSHLEEPLVMNGLMMVVTTMIIKQSGKRPILAPRRASCTQLQQPFLKILDFIHHIE